MNRVYFEGMDAALRTGDALTIDGEAHRHLVKALRSREGERFLATDGAGREFVLEVEAIEKRETRARVVQSHVAKAGPGARVTLAVAPPKGDRMDVAIEKACEIGVGKIVPLVAGRSIVKVTEDSARLERWRRIARSAMVQSGQSWETRIETPRTLAEMLKTAGEAATAGAADSPARIYFAHLTKDSVPLGDAIRGAGGADVAILIGPEGGFTDEEAERAKAAGAALVSLGGTKLRTETAAVVGVALAVDALRNRV